MNKYIFPPFLVICTQNMPEYANLAEFKKNNCVFLADFEKSVIFQLGSTRKLVVVAHCLTPI